MAPVSIKEIDEATEDYVTARDARMQMLETEIEAQANLLSLMHQHGLKEYEYDGRLVTVKELQKVSVRKAKAESNGEA